MASPLTHLCQICEEPIQHSDTLSQQNKDALVCRDPHCQRLHKQRFTMDSAVYIPYLTFQKKLIKERRESQRRKQEHITAVKNKEEKENQEILQNLKISQPISEHKPIIILNIPSGLCELSKLDTSRVEQYKTHLKNIITDAFNYANADEVPMDQHYDAHKKMLDQEEIFESNTELSSFVDTLCGMCKGGCCSTGEEHAFLTTITMRRLLDNDHSLTVDTLLDEYVSRISDYTVSGSCINQTETGCALSRHLRSDVCNSYFCDSLKSYQTTCTQPTHNIDETLVIIQRDNTNWNRFESKEGNKVVKVEIINRANQLT